MKNGFPPHVPPGHMGSSHSKPFGHHQSFGQQVNFGHHASAFGGHHGASVHVPKMFFLHTSPSKEVEPYWTSNTPAYVPPGTGPPPLARDEAYKIGYKHGYVWYICTDREDFVHG
jgi:hypothetical protein